MEMFHFNREGFKFSSAIYLIVESHKINENQIKQFQSLLSAFMMKINENLCWSSRKCAILK